MEIWKKDADGKVCMIFPVDVLNDSYNTLETDLLDVMDTIAINYFPSMSFLEQQKIGSEIASALATLIRTHYYVFSKEDIPEKKTSETQTDSQKALSIVPLQPYKPYNSVIFNMDECLESSNSNNVKT